VLRHKHWLAGEAAEPRKNTVVAYYMALHRQLVGQLAGSKMGLPELLHKAMIRTVGSLDFPDHTFWRHN
jgi:hypothetical protein